MVTFFHDHIFVKYKDDYYTTGSLNANVMKRYINLFGKIRLVTRQKNADKLASQIEPSSIPGTEFAAVPNYKSPGKIFNYFKARKIIKREVLNAEYIILRTSSIANIAARYARKYNKPYLVEVVGCAWDANWNYSLLGKLVAPFAYLAQKKTVRDADFAIYVTNEYLQRKYPNKNNTTNCSNVELTEFDQSTLEQRLEKIKKLDSQDKIIIGTTAAVNVRYKGQQYVIKALSRLKSEGFTNYEYQLAGGGSQDYLRSAAEKYGVSDKVKFLGLMQHDKVLEWLNTIDIYVQPSRQEGLPRALIEAMSRAVPAFGARTAGIPELLDKDFIFSNTRKNIDEICSILKSFDKKTMMNQAARNFEEAKKYDKSIIENRRNEFLRQFIAYSANNK